MSGGDYEEQARELLLSLGVHDVHDWLDTYYIDLMTATVANHEEQTGSRPAAVLVNFEDFSHCRRTFGLPFDFRPPIRVLGVQVVRTHDLPRLSVIVLPEVAA